MARRRAAWQATLALRRVAAGRIDGRLSPRRVHAWSAAAAAAAGQLQRDANLGLVVDPSKVRDYLLSTAHPTGRFKAAFFGAPGYATLVGSSSRMP